jgi:hypothetical protein
MLYINPVMLEPATVSIGLYLLAKTPTTINKTHKYLNRNPMLIKKKFCKWVLKNHDPLLDTIIEETNDQIIPVLNLIKINPSVFLFIYVIALFLVILF